MTENTAQTIKVRKMADQGDAFEVLIDGVVVGRVTKTKRNAAPKQGRVRSGYKMRTAWTFSINADLVHSSKTFGTVITGRRSDAVDLIVERVTAAR